VLALAAIAVLGIGCTAGIRCGAAQFGRRRAGAGVEEQTLKWNTKSRFPAGRPEIFVLTMVSVILIVDLFLPDRLRVWTYILTRSRS